MKSFNTIQRGCYLEVNDETISESAYVARGGMSEPSQHPRPQSLAEANLTQRELDVLRLLIAGKFNKEIAAALGICEKTVEKHLFNIFWKLHVQNRVEAAMRATQHGLT